MLCNMIVESKTQRRQVLIILNWKMASSRCSFNGKGETECGESRESQFIQFKWDGGGGWERGVRDFGRD